MARGKSKNLCCNCANSKGFNRSINICCGSKKSLRQDGMNNNDEKDKIYELEIKEIISVAIAEWTYQIVKCGKIRSPKDNVTTLFRSLFDQKSLCFVCGKKASLSCTRCLTVFYCSNSCQVKDWKDIISPHKKI